MGCLFVGYARYVDRFLDQRHKKLIIRTTDAKDDMGMAEHQGVYVESGGKT